MTATADFVRRRQLLVSALVAVLLLAAGGSYFLWRVVHQELAVARLQAEFVSAVSHEFRTPLTSLRHVTELLQEDDGLPGERRRAFYETLDRNTDRLQRLVESLLDFARMERGKKPYDLRPIDAAELTERVVTEFRREAAPRGFDVALRVDGSCPTTIRADAASLANALWNLLDNAVKYSPGRHAVEVAIGPHPAGVAIAVRDEGLGIPADEQPHVFGRFVRGRRASELGIKGTGLGLSMVSHIVRAHGGSLELQSADGAGSTFRIVLPSVEA